MANFLLIYTGGTPPASETEGAAVMKAWTSWFTTLGAAVVNPGNPTSPMVKHVAGNGAVADGPVGVACTGFSILSADSYDAAVALAKGCPHLAAGGQITVYETINVM